MEQPQKQYAEFSIYLSKNSRQINVCFTETTLSKKIEAVEHS